MVIRRLINYLIDFRETVTVEGADWNLKLGAIHLTFHPYAVSEPTQIVVHEWKNSACLPPLLEHEAVVSNVIEISTINEKPLKFKGDVQLFLSHSAPGLHGYEVVIKRIDLYETKDDWIDVDDTEDLSSLQGLKILPIHFCLCCFFSKGFLISGLWVVSIF